MSPPRPSLRTWWKPPQRAGDRPPHRQVSFLELFYDLVYVVLVAELAHALAGHLDAKGLASFAFLFITVWWAWFNGTTYHDIHGNNDIRTRVFTFLQMFTVVAMAIYAHDALGETSDGFAISYAAFQLILAYLWWRTGVYDPDHQPLSGPYSAGFLVPTLLFAGSVIAPDTWRVPLWAAALVVSLLLLSFVLNLGRKRPELQSQIDLFLNVSASLVERFGLFTIIVLGEVIVGAVGGVTGHPHATWMVKAAAALGVLIAVGLWWVYFDSVSHHRPKPDTRSVTAWIYLHLPLTIGIAAVGAAVLNVVEHAGEPLSGPVRGLLAGAVAVVLAAIALLIPTVQLTEIDVRTHRTVRRTLWVSALAIAALGFTRLATFPFLGAVAILLLAPVYFGVRVWVAAMNRRAPEAIDAPGNAR